MLTPGRTRHGRVLPVVVALLVVIVGGLQTSSSLAAGTGGIEVTPVPSQAKGAPVTTFKVQLPSSGSKRVRYTLRNIDAVPRTARVFAAKVTLTDGVYALGDAGSSPYVTDTDRTVTLQPKQQLQETFEVHVGTPPDKVVYAAIVVEVRNGSVVQNAATLITLRPPAHRIVGLPVGVVVVALVVLVLAALGLLLVVVRRRAEPVSTKPATPVG